uniref:Uncharacterized protein n=1 Tax=Thermocrinis ruber TaxID=75906 RepID=A0A7C5X3X6_9AQUI
MWLNKVFLITFLRFLLFLFFILHAILYLPGYTQKAVVVVISSLYLSVALVNYFYSFKLRRLNDYIDFFFLIPLALLSGEPLAIFSLLVPSLFSFPKNLVPLFISVLSATALGVYYFGLRGLLVFPLTLALGISPSSVELLRSLQKDRRYFLELRGAYGSIQEELSTLEREKRQKEMLLKLLELLDSNGPEEYLNGVKEMFKLKAINVFPLKDSSVKECLIDEGSLTISVPVSLEEGSALVVFYLNHPAELMDTELKENLIRCAKMLSFYITGFEDKEQAVKIAV